MKVIDLKQNSPDWLIWREGGIGASDVPIILWESPFKGAYQLWMEKTGRCPKPAPTRATTHGQVSEDTARSQLSQELGIDLYPASVMDDEAEYLRASYDACHLESGIIAEIKCPLTPKDHRRAKEGEIPWYYRIQMYQQMHIARIKDMIYYSWFNGEGIRLEVKLDEEFWFGIALPEIQEFWRRVQMNEWPQPNGETVEADNKELRQAAMDWFQAKKMAETAEYCQRIAEAEFKRQAGDTRNFISNGVQCQQQVWKGKYLVEIHCESPAAQEAVLKACLPLEDRINVEVRTKTFEPKIVHKFMEIK